MEVNKKAWEIPDLIIYGNVEDLTRIIPIKQKSLGTIDDFGVPGISDA